MSLPTDDGHVAWEMRFGKSETRFVCHTDGAIYMCFDWNGTGVWEWVGNAGQKRFPKWLRDVSKKMEKKL